MAIDRFTLQSQPVAAGAKRGYPMAGSRFAHFNRTLGLRAVVVSVLEELRFICPVAVATGSLIMIGIKLWSELPQ